MGCKGKEKLNKNIGEYRKIKWQDEREIEERQK